MNVRLWDEMDRRYDRLPDAVLLAVAAANRTYGALSPRQRLTQDAIAWHQEIDDRRVILAELGLELRLHQAWLVASEPGSDRRAIAENRHPTLIRTWKLHASLLIQAARAERKLRAQIAAMRPVLVPA